MKFYEEVRRRGADILRSFTPDVFTARIDRVERAEDAIKAYTALEGEFPWMSDEMRAQTFNIHKGKIAKIKRLRSSPRKSWNFRMD